MVNMALFYPHWPHLLRVVSRADERRAGLYTVPGKTRGDMVIFVLEMEKYIYTYHEIYRNAKRYIEIQ